MDRSENRDVVLPKLAFTIKEAERSTGISAAMIHRAIHSTNPWSYPPPLHAKRAGARYLILASELMAWLESLRDADDEPYGSEPPPRRGRDPLARSVRSKHRPADPLSMTPLSTKRQETIRRRREG